MCNVLWIGVYEFCIGGIVYGVVNFFVEIVLCSKCYGLMKGFVNVVLCKVVVNGVEVYLILCIFCLLKWLCGLLVEVYSFEIVVVIEEVYFMGVLFDLMVKFD